MTQEKINVGVSFAKLVISEHTAKVGEPVKLQLIEGLTPSGIIWRSGNIEVPTPENLEIVFSQPGEYIPVILGCPQHKSYAIVVTI